MNCIGVAINALPPLYIKARQKLHLQEYPEQQSTIDEYFKKSNMDWAIWLLKVSGA
jgi:hypothetical protein